MLKAVTGWGFAAFFVSGFMAAGVPGCAGKPSAPDHGVTFTPSEKPSNAKALWSRKMPGFITDLSVARNANALLVAIIPDYDREKGTKQFSVSMLDHDGKTLWTHPLQFQVKNLDLSADGSLAVVTTHNNEILGLDNAGKKLWSTEGTCRPMILSRHHKILCYHDDDAEPQVAFDIFEWDGKKSYSFPIKNDVLSLKVSADEQNVALGLTKGVVHYVGPDFKSAWNRKVKGEIADVAVSAGENPQIAVLYNEPKKGQKISLFDENGKLLGEGQSSVHVSQLEISPAGGQVLGYGNGPKGQNLALFDLEGSADKPELAQKWYRGDARYADYASSMVVSQELAIIGFEDILNNGRHSHLIAFDFDGKVKWNIPVQTEEGAYLYAQGYAPQSSFLAVGTDDATLSAFQIGQ
jgi:outer membrane protein assembly factor BamB